MCTLPLIRWDSLMDIRWSRYNELGSCWTRKLRRSNAGRKKKGEPIKTGSGAAGYCMSLSLEFWRIAEFNSRAHCGISRGEREVAKSKGDRFKKKRKRKKYRDIRTWVHLLRTGRTRQTTFLEWKFIENYFTVQLLAICSLPSENFLRDRNTSTL